MKTEKKICIAFILNLFFAVFEFVGGVFTGSIAIISDAVHDLGDATGIGASFFLEKKSKRTPDETHTFGYTRYSALGGMITTLILIFGSLFVILNAMRRLFHPVPLQYTGMLIVAAVGLTVNLIASFVTHGGHSSNQKAVNLHMIEDVLGWLGVLVGAVIMRFTNFYLLDPILSLCVALFFLIHACKHLKEILNLFLLKTPKKIDVAKLWSAILEIDGILDAHHLHISSLNEETIISSLHIVTKEYNAQVKSKVKQKMREYGICHVTVEMETENETCAETNCNPTIQNPHCHHHH